MISTQLPAVVTVVRLPYEPRYPTIKSKMAAKKKEIPVLTEEDIQSGALRIKWFSNKSKEDIYTSNRKEWCKTSGY